MRGDVYDSGDIDAGVADAGQSMGLIQDVPTVKELIDEGALKYWSSGSTTYLMLPEFFPESSRDPRKIT
jgi:predicted phosphohydrolase